MKAYERNPIKTSPFGDVLFTMGRTMGLEPTKCQSHNLVSETPINRRFSKMCG